MSRVLATALVLAGVWAWMSAPSEAIAATPVDKVEARRQFDIGVARAKAGAYREAVEAFKRAYELSPNFAVLYNVATAQSALGDSAAALATFERYLTEGGAAVGTERRARVAAEMKKLVPRTGAIVPRAVPPTARVTLDDVVVEGAPAGGVRVNVGVHHLTATAEGYLPAEQVVSVDSGAVKEVTLTLTLEPASPAPELMPPPPPPAPPAPAAAPRPPTPIVGIAAPPPAPAAPAGKAQRTVGYTLGAAGLVGLAVGGALYLGARSDLQKAIDAGCNQSTCLEPGRGHWEDAQAGVRNARIAAGVGGALLVGGTVLVVLAPSAPGAPAGVALVGRF